MNHMPVLNRRAFIVGTAAIGSRPRARIRYSLRRPDRGSRRRRRAGSQRLGRNPARRYRGDPHRPLRDGAGHADRPRSARRRGTRCDWSKVTTEYPTPGQSAARKRVWGSFSTGGSIGIRASQQYVRKGGAAARMMLISGGGERMERAGDRVHRRQQRHHAYAFGPHHYLRQGGGSRSATRAAGGRQAERPQGLEDRGQEREAARHRRQDHRQDDLRHRRQIAGHAQRRDQGLSGIRRQAEELR